MKTITSLIFATAIGFSQSSFASNEQYDEAHALFETHCAACHGASVGGMDSKKRVAPPIGAVRMHYIEVYPDEAGFVQAVSNWVAKQDVSKSLMRGAIHKFNNMPPVSISPENANKIAAYIFAGDLENPEGLEQPIREEHANRGKGKGYNN